MKVRNIEIELGIASYQLAHKRFLDIKNGTSLEQFQFDLRSAIHKELLEKSPYGIALSAEAKKAMITLEAQRPYGSRQAKLAFEFSLNTETHVLLLQKMTMELSSKPDQPLVWTKSSGEKMPSADKAFLLIEGKKHQDRKPANGRQIRGGHHNNNRRP